MEEFERSSLWKNSLGLQNINGAYSKEIEELRTAFFNLRRNVSFLVSRISTALPSLTQHEISHLDALWDTASLITGENYPINPLEGFILGGAFLIHDSALCFEAYKNGQIGLRETPQWKDAFSEIVEGKNYILKEAQNLADFIALRELHAAQAEILLKHSWKDPASGEDLYLLDNFNLRKHLSSLIGQIAASHHWEIENLALKFNAQQNSLSHYPREWRIDPIKLSCILRCADASHIDNLRAPDFLHALLKRTGISFNHWQAQNRISKVDLDYSDPNKETIVFNSTFDFSEEDSNSWFVMYDAACLVDKELKSSNALLSNRNSSLPFQVKKVKGIESPESFAKYIKVSNWKPCSSQIHVGNVERLIDNLGGEMLYGAGNDLFGVAVRELIQNSIDSINARKFVESNFEGKILVKILELNDSIWLIVEDNGIGMSERVLTGPLLDFGTSFWSSSLVKSEFPGLRSSSFKSIGKFGIGFYSVFMIAQEVYITSRNWNEGLKETRELKFKDGFTLRPLLTKGQVNGFHSSISTQVKLKLKPDIISNNFLIEIKTSRMGQSNFVVPIEQYLASLVAGVDVNIYYSNDIISEIKIHEKISSSNHNNLQWLKTLSFAEIRKDQDSLEYITKNVNRLAPIIDNKEIKGLAAISTKIIREQDFLSISTVGGLAHSVHHRDGENFIGFIDHLPKSAKREIGEFSFDERLIKEWAKNQLDILMKLDLNSVERYCAASSLCHFKTDPSIIAHILIAIKNNKSFLSFDQLADLSKTIGIAFIESGFGGKHMETHHDISDIPGYALVIPLFNSTFLTLKLLNNNVAEENFSIFDCLYRCIIRKGYTPSIQLITNIGINKFGEKLNALIVKSE